MSLFFHIVDDAFIQSFKEVFGGGGNKKNLVDPFVEARFAGRKVLCFVLVFFLSFQYCMSKRVQL